MDGISVKMSLFYSGSRRRITANMHPECAGQAQHRRSGWLGVALSLAVFLPGLALAVSSSGAPSTFCNPLNLDYGWSSKGSRHSADPVIVLFKDRYYLFATDDVPGYRVSDDLLTWTNILFAPELRLLMSDNNRGTYCAPAVAADKSYVYFIRMSRGKREKTVPVMRSAVPASGRWEKCGELRVTGDPDLFLDDDGRAWLYHGLGQPTKVFEINTKTWTEIAGSERQLRPAITNLADFFGGYERGRRELLDETDPSVWLGRFKILPCQEAAWMTKRDGRYYLQYATPGTVTQWYCDAVMEGESPTGPFRHVDYAPASLKVGGFMGSAGHSCVFQDKYGNWWRATTMWVGVHDLFERRLGLFPVGFDENGRMFTETALGDNPQWMPQGLREPTVSPLVGWRVQSFGRQCAASSFLTNHPPALAADENCRTWWSARTSNAGEWFQMDLDKPTRVGAVQVNFAEQDCDAKPLPSGGELQRYKLLASDDGKTWRPLAAPGARRELAVGVREAIGPHDYLAFAETQSFRFLKVENVFSPAGGKFALRDLRVFGPGEGEPPRPVANLEVTRHSDDDRNATVTWTPRPNADGYLVRFGIAPDRLFQTIQVQGGTNATLATHALNRGGKYAWRVDAFNASGITQGPALRAE
jgi:xylan 1,4-beta-xylosidase